MSAKRTPMTMNSTVRRQGGAAVMTIPPAFLRQLHLDVGSQLELSVVDGALVVKPMVRPARKRYSLAELLKGAEHVAELNEETHWAREGGSVGREIG